MGISVKILKLGFIGGGIDSAIGYTHFIASQMDHRFILEAGVFSRDYKKSKQTANVWLNNKCRIYKDYKEMLKKEQNKLDAIVVLTPTISHKQIVIDVLNAQYDVICEKTLCLNTKEVLEILSSLNNSGQKLVITYNYTGYCMLRELQAMIEHGDLGKITHIQIEMPQEGYIKQNNGRVPVPQVWRTQDLEIPIISLDLGVHIYNLVAFLTKGAPKSIYAINGSYGTFDVIDDVNILLRWDSLFSQDTKNINVSMWYSKSALGYRNGLNIRIFGDKKSAEWVQSEPEILKINLANGERMHKDRASPGLLVANLPRYSRFKPGHPSGFIEAFANYYVDVADYLLGQESQYVFGVSNAIDELNFFEGVEKSVKSHKEINLNI